MSKHIEEALEIAREASKPSGRSASSTFSPYITLSRAEWAKHRASTPMLLTEAEVQELRGLNDRLSIGEVEEIYLPLSRLLMLYVAATQNLYLTSHRFLGTQAAKVPYIIGIAGSVAVGKSTTARIIQALLSRWENHPKVDLITTDGFLYPNRVLEERGLMSRKGFPESYDVRALLQFLIDVKSGKPEVEVPVYSHLVYDIVQDKKLSIRQPDILIVEGLNVLQTGADKTGHPPRVFVSDFFDFSIYVDAEEDEVRRWYIERFHTLRQTAFRDPNSYFKRYAALSDTEAEQVAGQIWDEINGINLRENIQPTKDRAQLILEKGEHHFVQSVKLRKL